MNAKALMVQHVKETAELKRSEKAQWNQLLKDQEIALMNSDDPSKLASRFEKEREEHNEYFSKAKADLMRKQQQDLEEFKRTHQQTRSDEEHER